jgi:hypothetical protein
MAAATGTSYSLWIEPPPGTLRDRLRREVGAQRAARAGPPFEAHVTLLGGICAADEAALLETAAQLAARIQARRLASSAGGRPPTSHRRAKRCPVVP